MGEDEDEKKFNEARRETIEALREAFPDRHEEIWETIVRGIIRASIAVRSEARDSGRCGNPDCNLCRDDVAHSRSDDDEGGPDTDS